MNKFLSFFTGFVSSLFLLTATDFETLGGGFEPLIKYIGPAVLGGCIFTALTVLGKEIDKLKNEIKELKKN